MQSFTTSPADSTDDVLEGKVEQLQDVVPTLLKRGEKLYSPYGLAKALKNVPGHRGGPHLNPCTLFRQITKGTLAKNGERIRLEAIRCGTRWLSSVEAFGRYVERLTAASLPTDTPAAPPATTPKQLTSAAAKASKQADAIFGAT